MPCFGEIKIQELTPALVDNFLRVLTSEGLAKGTLSNILTFLSHALDYAVYPAQIITSNPAKYIKVSKKAPTNIVERKIISQERFNELLEKYPFGTSMHIPLMLLYHTGMRLGEVCGLMWQDVNLSRGVISLRQQIVYIRKRGHYLTAPKTNSSVREILMDKYLASELRRWKKQQIENEVELSGGYVYVYRDKDDKIIQQSRSLTCSAEKAELVCTHNDGHCINQQYVQKTLTKEKLNAHSFRHTHATVLIENGATPKGVAGRLGHSNAAITQNLYTHNTQKLQDDTMSIFEKILQTNA